PLPLAGVAPVGADVDDETQHRADRGTLGRDAARVAHDRVDRLVAAHRAHAGHDAPDRGTHQRALHQLAHDGLLAICPRPISPSVSPLRRPLPYFRPAHAARTVRGASRCAKSWSQWPFVDWPARRNYLPRSIAPSANWSKRTERPFGRWPTR